MDTDPLIEIIEVDPSALESLSPGAQGAPVSAPKAEIDVAMDTVFRLRGTVRNQLKSIRLPVRCWEILHRVDGKRSVEEIAQVLEEPSAHISADCHRLLCQGLLVENQAISFDVYRGHKSQRPATPTPPEPTATMEPEPPPVATVDDTAVGMRSSKQTTDQLAGHPELLTCLMDTVREARGGGRRGELAVYLMFTRVPSELFREAGLRSFLYIDENTRISHEGLAHRLIKEAELLLGHALGDQLRQRLNGSLSRPN